MFKYKFNIEYHGKYFHGWQVQPKNISVQQVIEDAIYETLKEKVHVISAGRTDAGVHAIAHCAHFETSKELTANKMQGAINYYLKNYKASVFNMEKLPLSSDFHARYSAKARTYIYKILNTNYPPSIKEDLYWWVSQNLNISNMLKASKHLIGTHDFTSFRAKKCSNYSPIKTIYNIDIIKNNSVIYIKIRGNAFLYHQVRNIVGSLYYVGIGKWNKDKIKEVLLEKNRNKAGITAPAKGLYLEKVEY